MQKLLVLFLFTVVIQLQAQFILDIEKRIPNSYVPQKAINYMAATYFNLSLKWY